jgi:C4-dicarboxylate-specific signal transduction histidine kinase
VQGEAARGEVDQIFGDIARQGQRASEVIQRLREFLRKETPERASLDLHELVRGVLPLVRREIEDREVRLEVDFPSRLPRITGDRVQLQQIVVNLIQNACEAMQASPPPRRLVLRSRMNERGVELTLSDSGPGVAPGMEARIFEPFVSTKAAGMGVGLSICRSIVENHGGTLKLEEAPEGGARFCLHLPVEELGERSA